MKKKQQQKNKKTTKKKKHTHTQKEILLNKPEYLGYSILDLNEILMYQFSYDYVKPKYSKKAKLSYMGYRDTDSFMVDLKAYDIYKGIEKDVEIRFDTSNHELERALPKGRNKKVI